MSIHLTSNSHGLIFVIEMKREGPGHQVRVAVSRKLRFKFSNHDLFMPNGRVFSSLPFLPPPGDLDKIDGFDYTEPCADCSQRKMTSTNMPR